MKKFHSKNETGESLSYDNLRSFDSKVFVLDKDPTKDKSARSLEGIFVGYPRETKGFRNGSYRSIKPSLLERNHRFLEEMNDIVKNSSILDDLTVEKQLA